MTESIAGSWTIDSAASRAIFSCKTFWGLFTVRGTLGAVSGSGTGAGDGTITGRLVIDAASVKTKHWLRDRHLRSADFFNVREHPNVVVTITAARLNGSELGCQGTVEAAGRSQNVRFTAHVDSSGPGAIVLRGELTLDRRSFGMTWNRLGMVGAIAVAAVTAHFVRA